MSTPESICKEHTPSAKSGSAKLIEPTYLFSSPPSNDDNLTTQSLGYISRNHKLPNILVVFKADLGTWDVTYDTDVISRTPYLYVSCLGEHLESTTSFNFEAEVQWICKECNLNAYWMERIYGDKVIDSNDRLRNSRSLGDIIKGASKTLVFIKSGNNKPRSSLWLAWGSRVWTLPELAFSRDLMYKCGEGKPKDIDKGQMCKLIYNWEYQDLKTKLIYIHSELRSSEGTKSPISRLQPIDLVLPLIRAIWGNDDSGSNMVPSSISMERVYAFMTFLPNQIVVDEKSDDFINAFQALMKANNWSSYKLSPASHSDRRLDLTSVFDEIFIPRNFFYDKPDMLYPTRIMRYSPGPQTFYPTMKNSTYKYVAISYGQVDDSEIEDIKEFSEHISIILFKIDGYWLDCQCVSGSHDETDNELYHIADVYLRATETVVMFPDISADRLDSAWEEWGRRVWSLPEILLSAKLSYCTEINSVISLSKREALTKAYGLSDKYAVLAEHFELNKVVQDEELWPCLMAIIWRNPEKIGGKLFVGDVYPQGSKYFPEYKAERVYALMAFMPVRNFPTDVESERQALERLIRANGFSVSKIRASLQSWCDEHFKQESFYLELNGILNDIQVADYARRQQS